MVCAMPALAADSGAHSHSDHDASQATPVPKARAVTSHGTVTVDGKTIHYTATTGNILLRDDNNKPIGSMFYIAYTKDGNGSGSKRPVTFLYNGGPGSSSLWLQMGGIGPMRVDMGNGEATAPAPYQVRKNPYTLLNDSDLVFIDAMGTGYSYAVGKAKPKQFWGVDQDVHAFGQFIRRYLNKFHRWNSPKFLYGESYGTTRSAALSNYLQDQGIALNGVVLQSSVLNYFAWMPGSDDDYIYNLPTYAALAWYYDKVPNKPAKLADFVQQAREFADGPYLQALERGDTLSSGKAQQIAERMHQLIGLPVEYIKRADLRIDPSNFRKELNLPQGKMIGRYDGRYAGQDMDQISSVPGFDPSNQFISPAFTAAFHGYLNNTLKWNTDRKYRVMNGKIIQKWDWKHHGAGGNGWQEPMPYVAGDLAAALRKNPYLRVLSENGYYDLATPFHATEYDLNHMMLKGDLRSHVKFAYFPSGHMIYLNPKALKAMHARLDRFYANTLKADQTGPASK
ncbi:peptidase S10 [Oleiagrimonas sp. C23AA]|nr:peptidase S10 [Oleiagrimonas sp. C23AA]